MFKHFPQRATCIALFLTASLTLQIMPVAAATATNVSVDTKVATSPQPQKAGSETQASSARTPLKAYVSKNDQPLLPLAPVITATLTDNITAATKVAPGGTINYTATITNTGASPANDATNLNFSAPLDSNTTLVPGSVHASPIAFNDTYNWVGNTQLDTAARALPAVTGNDIAVNAPAGTDTFTVTAIAGGATALGGTVTLASPSGAFTYTPPLGRPNVGDGPSVNDSFTYTITNNADPTLTSTGTVTITLTGRVWYLQAGAAGDGRSNTPSNSPSAMSTAADKSTDVFYIFSNAGSLNGPFSVDAGQQLLGQGVNLVVSAITLFTAAAPTPTTTNTAGSCVALAGAPGNNTLAGFNIGNCTGGTAITGANVGTLNVSTMSINTNGGALDLTGVGAPTASVVLGGTTSTGGAKNVNLVGLNGTFTLASGALSGATTNAFDVNGGTAAITYSGTISNSGAKQVNVANKTGGSVALSGAVGGTGTGVNLTTNTGATISFTGGVAISSGTNAAFTATGGGTVTATQNNTTIVNTLTTSSGTALNVANTTIGAAGLTFRSITSNGATNGIILNTTGGTGSLTVSGNGGSCTSVATCTGGSIQTATVGISLNSTTSPSFDRMLIQTTTDSGVNGTSVTNFSFTNGKIDSVGNANFDSAIGFNGSGTGLGNNIAGTLTVTGNTLTNSYYSGVDVQSDDGTVTNANISNNTITTTTVGLGINFNGQNSATTAFNLQNATINQNNISGISGTGIQAQCSSSNAGGPGASCGTPGDGTKLISITNNSVTLTPAATQGITITSTGGNSGSRAKGNFLVQCNGRNTGGCTAPTAAALGSSSQGTVILIGNNGFADMTAIINNNSVVATHTPNLGGGNGIAGGNGVAGAGNAWTPQLTLTVTNNSVSGTDGNGILLVGRGTSGFANMKITNNTVGTPVNAGGTARESIRVDAGNAASADDGVCVTIASNTCAIGSNGAGGIGIRKQGVVQATNDFGITGLAPSPATGAQAAAFVVTQNPAGNGCDNISGSAFQSCATAPPIAPPADDSAMIMPPACSSTLTAQSATPAMFAAIAQPQTLAVFDSSMIASLNNSSQLIEVPRVINGHVEATVTPVVASVAPASTSYRVTLGSAMHHVINTMASAAHTVDSMITPTAHAQEKNDKLSPDSGENVTLNAITTLPAAAGGKSITIKYSATVNTPPLARSVSTQGTVTAAGGISVLTDDPEPGGASDPTVTLVDTLMTWNGVTSTDWNTATNWTQPAGGTQYAPGVSNPAVNDVVIPNVGNQPNISATDIGVYSLSLANGRTLTITNPRVLTIGGSPGGDLTLDGIIAGGFLNLGTGAHVINNAGGTGSLSSTNVATVLSGSTVTLNNNLQVGALAVNAGGSMTIASKTLSLNGSGAALTVPGGATFTTTSSTVVFNGTAAQQAAGIAYNNLTINNTIGLNVTGVTLTGNATVNGALALTSSDLATGAFTLTQPNTTASTGVSDVVGAVKRTGGPFPAATVITFGNPNNQFTFSAAGTKPTDMTVTLAKTAPASYATAVTRNFSIATTGGSGYTTTVRLHYLDTELNGNTPEANLGLRRLRTGDSHWVAAPPPPGVPTRDGAANWIEATGVLAVDLPTQWTFSTLAPTASNGTVSGTIVDSNGNPVEGAAIRMNGTQNRLTVTDANGFYHFENVETEGIYTIVPSRANFNFAPMQRSFTLSGANTDAAFNGVYNGGTANPLDRTEYFVRQQYVDFLNREPDEPGLNFWVNSINGCGEDQSCVASKRTETSAAFFLSIEFQQTGYLVYRMYQSAYGDMPGTPVPVRLGEFKPDSQAIGLGVVVNAADWEAKLEANKVAFAESFVQRARFAQAYPTSLTPDQFVDLLFLHAGVTPDGADRAAAIAEFSSIGDTADTAARGRALRKVAENATLRQQEFNQAFVLMQYFGYLRRDPNSGPDTDYSGYNFWLNKLESFNGNYGDAQMVEAFLVAGEYRHRFPK